MERETKRSLTIISLTVCISIFLITFVQCRKTKVVSVENNQIDSLRIVNDSIKLNIDSIDSIIINLGKEYETNYNIILYQSTDSDVLFFTNYISTYSK